MINKKWILIPLIICLLLRLVLPLAAQTDLFLIAYGDTISDGIPGAGAGNIEVGGALDVYSFEGSAGDSAIFDVLTGSTTLRWSLIAPDSTSLFNSVYLDRQQELPQTGTYTLTVNGSSTSITGTYSFRLLLTPPAQLFALNFGDTVANGVPAAGAGNLEVPGARDIYSFNGTAGQEVVFDILSGSNAIVSWRLEDSGGTTIFDSFIQDRQVVLTQSGLYTLTLHGSGPVSVGLYSFRLLLAPTPQFFAISVGDTISDGVPAAGAGNLETPGARDIYSFDAAAGQELLFDILSGSNSVIGWRLEAPDSTVLFDTFITDRQQVLDQTGTYTLTLRGNNPDNVGLYSFRLLYAPVPEQFTISFGDTVSDGVPAIGAGNLETPGAIDRYTFDGIAGQEALFDILVGNGGLFRWRLDAPDGTAVFDVPIADRQVTLPQSGTYTLTIRGSQVTSFGVYSFQLGEVLLAAEYFAIAFGDTVADGVPAAGAGNLESAGTTDVYTFDAVAGQAAIFDVLAGSAGQFLWRLDAPDGSILFNGLYVDRTLTLTQTGTYTVKVRGYPFSHVGVYSFQLLNTAAPQYFAINFGDTVSDGIPAAGAGNLEAPGSIDNYTFDASAGQQAIFDFLSGNNVQIGWQLQAPDSTILFNSVLGDHQVTLNQTGTYTLTLRGNNPDDVGLYSFRLLLVPAAQVFNISLGDTVSDGVPSAGAGNLEMPGAADRYHFDALAGQEALFDTLTGGGGQFHLQITAPDTTVLFDGFYSDQQMSLTQTGTYTLLVTGADIDSEGSYSFALLEIFTNRSPVASDDMEATDEDTIRIVDVLANDTDADGDTLAVESVSQPTNGTVANNLTNVTYTPDLNFNGIDVFTYVAADGNGGTSMATVTVTVRSVNDDPVANDDNATTNEDTAITIDVLANDTDVDGDTLSIQSVSQPTNGTVINNGADLTYTPNLNFNGGDTFTYTIHDGYGGSATATVIVNINPVNDDPVANDDDATSNEDTAITIDVLANDTDVDGDTLTIQSVSQPTNGTVTHNGSDVTYTPNANFNGIDSFEYTVSDGNGGTDTATVTVCVGGDNDAPMALDDYASTDEDVGLMIDVLANDSDPDGDPLTIEQVTQAVHGAVVNNGINVSYTPNLNFNGADAFTYTITDGRGGTDTATVTVTINSVNDAPTIDDAAFDVLENSSLGTLVGTLSADDVDAGTTLNFAITSGNNGDAFALDDKTGAITVNGALDHETTPTYTLTITVTDDGSPALADTASVTITVLDVDEIPPTADIVDVLPDPRSSAVSSISITFSEAVTGFDLNDLILVRDGNPISLQGVTLSGGGDSYSLDDLDAVTDQSGTYMLTLSAGSSSIEDAAGNTLAGDASDTWQVDAIMPVLPVVISSVRADSNPTNAQIVSFIVTFDQDVIGVDITDYLLSVTGSISGMSVTGVSGGSAVYIVTVDTGTGDGTLRLEVLNDGSIENGSGLDLSGGTFSTGEAYTISRSAPGSPTPVVTETPLPPPPPPPAPTCDKENRNEHSGVHTGIPDRIRHAINCRVLYWNGQVTTWLGNALYSEANLGVAGILDLDVEQAVDIFSPPGMSYFDGGAVFCLRGSGTLIWLAASGRPRHAEIIGSYTVPEFPGFTCATLFEPGTLILVRRNPLDR